MGCGARRLGWAALALWQQVVEGQKYLFENAEAPDALSLRILYGFYVFSQEDAPSSARAPEHDVELPAVTFSDIQRVGSATGPYNGLQLSLIKYLDYLHHLDTTDFCCLSGQQQCTPGQIKYVNLPGASSLPDNTFAIDVGPGSQKVTRRITESGVYLLLLSNCGKGGEGMRVNGEVIVENVYGYLPGNSYHKWDFYGYLAAIYAVFLAAWVVRCFLYRTELFKIHYCIGVAAALGILESLVWFYYYRRWNSVGVRPQTIFIIGIVGTVMKRLFAQILVLLGALGWGVTRPNLSRGTTVRIIILGVLYAGFDSCREIVLALRQSMVLPLHFVVFVIVPMFFLHTILVYWIFTALSDRIGELEVTKQREKLQIYLALWKVLLLAVGTLCVGFLYEIYTFSAPLESQLEAKKWTSLWIYTDALSHIIYFFVLAAFMWLWSPNETTKRYVYSVQLVGGGSAASLGGNDVELGEADAESNEFWQECTMSAPVRTPKFLTPSSPKVERASSSKRSRTFHPDEVMGLSSEGSRPASPKNKSSPKSAKKKKSSDHFSEKKKKKKKDRANAGADEETPAASPKENGFH